MRPSGAASLSLALGACSAGVLATYGGYLTLVVPSVRQGEAVSPFLWAVLAGLIPLGVLSSGVLASRPIFSLIVGAFTACLRMAVEFVLSLNDAPGFLKSNVREARGTELIGALIMEAVVWAAVAFLSFRVGAAFGRRRAGRPSHTR